MTKQNFKKKIALIGAGILLGTGVFGLAGCDDSKDENGRWVNSEVDSIYIFIPEGSYLVLEENDVCTLHKAKGYVEMDTFRHDNYAATVTTLELDCRKGMDPIHTNNFVEYGKSRPSKDKYDVLCPDCFEIE